jgi:hypothetical protein
MLSDLYVVHGLQNVGIGTLLSKGACWSMANAHVENWAYRQTEG